MYIITLDNGKIFDISPELLGSARAELNIVSEEWVDEDFETHDSIFSEEDIESISADLTNWL